MERELIKNYYNRKSHNKQVDDYGNLIKSKMRGFKQESHHHHHHGRDSPRRKSTIYSSMDDFNSRAFHKHRSSREQKEYSIALQHGVTQNLLRDELNIQEEPNTISQSQIKQILSKNRYERESAFAEIKRLKKLKSLKKLGIDRFSRNHLAQSSMPHFLRAGSQSPEKFKSTSDYNLESFREIDNKRMSQILT